MDGKGKGLRWGIRLGLPGKRADRRQDGRVLPLPGIRTGARRRRFGSKSPAAESQARSVGGPRSLRTVRTLRADGVSPTAVHSRENPVAMTAGTPGAGVRSQPPAMSKQTAQVPSASWSWLWPWPWSSVWSCRCRPSSADTAPHTIKSAHNTPPANARSASILPVRLGVLCCKSIAIYRKGFGRCKSKFKIGSNLGASRFVAASPSANYIAERCPQRRHPGKSRTQSG